VTVYISWNSPQVSGVAENLQVQSYYWSPTGCVSSNTHPFAAPCQPFFYGQALMPAGSISATGSVQNLTLSSASLLMTETESTLQQEQVSQVQGKLTPSATTLVDDGACAAPACTGGSTSSRTTAADADPSGATPNYSTTTLAAGPLSAFSTSGGSASFSVTNAAGDSGQSQSAVTANATYPCPPNPPQASSETDSLPCGGSKIRQAGTLSMSAVLNGLSGTDLGNTTIASIAAVSPAADSWAFANRQAVTGQSGNIEDTVDRQIGRVNVGGLPANLTAPAGWDQAFVVLTGYHDKVFASGGTSAAASTAAISAGTLKYWNGVGYTSVTMSTGSNYSVAAFDQTVSGTVGGKVVSVRMRLATGSPFRMASVPTTSTTSCGAGPCVSSAVSTIGSPVYATFLYTVSINGSTVVNLTLNVDLGTITAKSTYQSAPAAG
jgi:hypothetical protein